MGYRMVIWPVSSLRVASKAQQNFLATIKRDGGDGARSVAVRRRPRVTVLSTGRELREPGHSLAPGQIYDSNLPILAALLHADDATVRPMTAVADEAGATRTAVLDAAVGADLVLTNRKTGLFQDAKARVAVRCFRLTIDRVGAAATC
jgi:hypothetical protein